MLLHRLHSLLDAESNRMGQFIIGRPPLFMFLPETFGIFTVLSKGIRRKAMARYPSTCWRATPGCGDL